MDPGDPPPANAAAPARITPVARPEAWPPSFPTPRRSARPAGQGDEAVDLGPVADPGARARGFVTDSPTAFAGCWPALPDEFTPEPDGGVDARDRWSRLPQAEAGPARDGCDPAARTWAVREDAERRRFLEREQRGIRWSG